ncbi:hypothetical protein [Streptomyces sp. NPDC051704]|uniref:hypothetical protein n=1 Tax=Streptomyces sp. NPDC051704 TaxID=3365671 RepID=UPI0037982741
MARRLRVRRKSVYRWHELWRDGGVGRWPLVAPVGRGVVCRRGVWRSWPGFWRRGRPRMAGWRTRCGPRRGWRR